MKPVIIACMACLLTLNTVAQNLVPNPSFEEYDTCPQFLGQIDNAFGWYSSRQTPDYYNTCAPAFTVGSIPVNYYGNQYAASGNAYAGIMTRVEDDTWRESLSTELSSPLIINTKYYVSFKVCLAICDNPSLQHNYCGINKLGLLFSTNKYSSDFSPAPVCNNCAQIVTDSIVVDTSGWTRITGNLIADSNYTHINIGRFHLNLNTDTIQLSNSNCNAYYFIDDVCVSTDSVYAYTYSFVETNITHLQEHKVYAYPNPTMGLLSIEGLEREIAQIDIHNNLGELVHSENGIKSQLDLTHLPKGIYNLILHTVYFKTYHQLIIKL